MVRPNCDVPAYSNIGSTHMRLVLLVVVLLSVLLTVLIGELGVRGVPA